MRMAARLGIIAVLAVVGLGGPRLSHANFPPALTITVTKTADDNGSTCTALSCSLRGGITKANNQSAGTLVKVVVPKGLYTLTNGSLTVDNPYGLIVEIDGAGFPYTKVDGSGNAPDTSDFVIDTPAQISGLTIENGTGDNGAGIDFEGGVLTLSNALITHNRTNNLNGSGGGLYVANWYTPIHLTNDTFSYNVARYGGAIYTTNDTSLLDNVVVDHNMACNAFAVPTLSPFDAHNACLGDGQGGGLHTSSQGENTTVNGGSVTNNVAGSLANDKGEGGGVWGDWRTTLNRATVTNNVAGNEGGGFENRETGVVTGGWFGNNLAGEYGGAIGYDGDHTILNGVTISGNVAGGTFACTETLDIYSHPVSASCTAATGTQTTPSVNGCPHANSATYQCRANNGIGGAINSYDDISELNSAFTGNRAVSIGSDGVHSLLPECLSEGGAIYQDDGVTLDDGFFKNNAASCGGGIYADDAPTQAQDVMMIGNLATLDGGAYFGNDNGNQSRITLTASQIGGNKAGVTTGGLYTETLGDLVIQGATIITNNTATGGCQNILLPCK
jgi:CSLREA domain-containing protein